MENETIPHRLCTESPHAQPRSLAHGPESVSISNKDPILMTYLDEGRSKRYGRSLVEKHSRLYQKI